MSTVERVHKLQQDLQNELNTANQLLRLISMELKKIKSYTTSGAELETTIKENTSIMQTLANMQRIDITNLPPITREQSVMGHQSNQHMSQQNDSTQDSMEESQD